MRCHATLRLACRAQRRSPRAAAAQDPEARRHHASGDLEFVQRLAAPIPQCRLRSPMTAFRRPILAVGCPLLRVGRVSSLPSDAVIRRAVSAPARLGGQLFDDACQGQVSEWTGRSPRRPLAGSYRPPPTFSRSVRTSADSLKLQFRLARRRAAMQRNRPVTTGRCRRAEPKKLSAGQRPFVCAGNRRRS